MTLLDPNVGVTFGRVLIIGVYTLDHFLNSTYFCLLYIVYQNLIEYVIKECKFDLKDSNFRFDELNIIQKFFFYLFLMQTIRFLRVKIKEVATK